MDKHEALRQFFGYSSFRPGQEELIDAILAGRDVLGVMPTGGGKSLCYQIPALLLPGVTLVISPLISLMKDQVAALNREGVAAAYLNSSLSPTQQRLVCQRALQGAYRLLYVAPERLESPEFTAVARRLAVPLAAVDEAHCISQWGQDFRPSYLAIAAFLRELPRRPVTAAFTATATTQVQADILRLLELREPVRQVTGFDRPNLFFDVQAPKNKPQALLALLQERQGQSGIIYCVTRDGVEKVCARLCKQGFPATRYHAGLPDQERQQNQEAFQFDRRPVMVATNAFGMGIDKSNVSFVIHYNMPKSLEAYYQEAGRAGRDGEPADCILLYSKQDVVTARFLIQNSGNSQLTPQQQAQVRRQDYARLQAMVDYCRSGSCLRGQLLDYFGQAHPQRCGSCGNCLRQAAQEDAPGGLAQAPEEDITVPAQMILSCLWRIHKKLGYDVGRMLLVQVLRGRQRQRVLELGLNELSTFGLMRRLSHNQVSELVEELVRQGYLRDHPLYSALALTPAASRVLFQGERVSRRTPLEPEKAVAPERLQGGRTRTAGPAGREGLFEALKATRTQLAQAEQIPRYLVFSNATLADMAAKAPHTPEELLAVNGVGRVKAQKYGRAFLEAIAAYEQGAAPQEVPQDREGRP